MIFGGECENHQIYVKLLNDKLLKNDSLKGQPQDVVNIREEIDTLNEIVAKFVRGSQCLNKLLRYNRSPVDKSCRGYKGKKYVHDEDTIVCYFYGKVRHMTSKCKDLPKKGMSNAFNTSKKGPKKIILVAN